MSSNQFSAMIPVASGIAARALPGGAKLLSQPERGFPAASVKIGGEIAFVDSGVSDLGTLLAGIREGVEVVMLDPSRDALTQIAEVLAARTDLSAVHIIANGGAGRIDFESGSIDGDDLAAHAASLAGIGAALGAGGDLMLWACDTGAGPLGQAFIDAVARATGVDVAASSGPTGAAARGGDWTLELNSGAIEATAPLTGAGIDAYDGLLDDEPSGADATVTAYEDSDFAFSYGDFGFDDGTEGNGLLAVVITTLPLTGTLYLLDGLGGETAVTAGQAIDQVDISLNRLIYRPGADEYGAGYASFTFQVQDDGGNNDIDTTPNTITIDVLSVNDAPYLDLDYTDSTATGFDSAVSWQEGDAPVAIAFAVELDDDDADNSYGGATITAYFNGYSTQEDVLTILSVGDGTGELRVDGGDIYYEGTLVGTFTGGATGTPLQISFNGDACGCAVQQTIASIAFSNTSDTPDETDRNNVTIMFVDGGGTLTGGADTAYAYATVSVSSTNDAPTASIDAPGGAIGVTEQVAHDLKDSITLADVDDSGGTYTVTLSVTEGLLSVDPGTSGASVDDSDQQNIIITGTLAQIQALLGVDPTSVVSYIYDDDYLPFGTIDFDVTVDDGADRTTETVTIDVTPVNDAAELDLDFFTSGNDAVATYFQGDSPTPLAFYATFDDDNATWDGATLTIAITGATTDDQLTIDDVGTGLGEISLSGSDVLYEGLVVGSFTGGTNGDPLVITFNADACACSVEAVTYGILYENSNSAPGTSTRDVTFTFVDGDGTANGGADTATATVELTVTPMPSAPVIDEGAPASGDEDAVIELTGIEITDDGDPITGLVTVHLQVANGTITIRTDVAGGIEASDIIGGANGSRSIVLTGTPAEINATLAASGGLTYQGNADYNGADELTISAYDGTPGTALAISSLSAIPFFAGTTAVGVADIDGDLLDDLVLGFEEDGVDPGFIITLSGSPGGTPLPSLSPEAFAFGDFDGDGEIDIAFAAYDDGGAGYVGYLSSDTGDVELLANVPYALDLVAADFNGDGLMDLAVADSDNGRVGIIMQTSAGVFAAPDYSASETLIANGIRTGDFNGDGEIDLLVSYYGEVGTYAPPGAVAVMLGNGDGTFGTAAPAWVGLLNIGGLVVGDFNGDGTDDFAFTTIDDSGAPGALNGVQVSLGNGDGTFGTSDAYVTTATGSPQKVITGDLNGDGILDLLVTNFDDPGTFSVLVGNGDGSFQTPVDFDTGDLAYVAATGDFDGDGDLDIMIGNYGDGTFEAFNNDAIARGTTTTKAITVDATDDASDALDDSGATVAENATVGIDVRSNDTDIDSAVESVAEIDGQAVAIGGTVTLASGATVTRNADGTLTYNPNGAFNSLISAATALATGAVNTSAQDSFLYTLAGGDAATVTVTVTGVQSAGDQLRGDNDDDDITGTSGSDIFMLHDDGDDTADGGDGVDGFFMGSSLSPGDDIDGGASNDLLGLRGDYNGYTFSATNLVGIETLVLLSGSVTTYGGGSAAERFDYDLTTIDANVGPGQMFVVNATTLLAGEDLRFDGSAETDGSFFFYGGAGNDTLIGGDGNDIFASGLGQDTLTGGDGNDVFYFRLTAESPDDTRDSITDFTAGDLLHIWALGEPGGLGIRYIGGNSFSNRAGELRVSGSGTDWAVEIDVDGDGDADFTIDVTTTVSGYGWSASDFIL